MSWDQGVENDNWFLDSWSMVKVRSPRLKMLESLYASVLEHKITKGNNRALKKSLFSQ